jgi:uncharacterized membrane protein YhaH (DUF805 family)
MDSRIEKLQSCLAQFRQMPEASMLIEYRSRQNRLTFDDRMAVTRCIEKTFAPVFLDMRAESPSLSESDLIFCALAAAGFKPEVISDCISISKESLRMRRKRIKEKLSPFWAEQLFPEAETVTKTVTKTVTGKCYDNGTQHISGADDTDLLLRQNQSNAKVMETKKITFGEAINSGFRNMFKFTGRASRTEFWYFILFYTLVFYTLGIVVSFLIPFVMLKTQHPITPESALMIVSFIAFILIIPLVSITVRRLHDSERKGAWVLSYLLPMIIAMVSVIYSMFHLSLGERTETETATSFNPAEYYNKYTDSDGDTIRIYPDYMEQVLSGKRFFYYKTNGDSIAVEPGVFSPINQPSQTQQVNREQKLIYGTAGIISFLVIISIVGFILLIIFCAMPGTEGHNRYGPDPNVITQPAS